MQEIIFGNLLKNEDYMRAALPYLKSEYFEPEYSIVLKLMNDLVDQYNMQPNRQTMQHTLNKLVEDNILKSEQLYNKASSVIKQSFEYPSEEKLNWLIDQTEKYCNEKAVYNAVLQSVDVINGEDKETPVTAIPQILQEAINVSFDNSVGHSYEDDVEDRYEFYHQKMSQLPIDIDMFNTITDGGFPLKSLIIAMGGTGTGKTLHMCHIAASLFKSGKNVLYISMEMAAEKIAERIDANLLNIDIQDIKHLSKDMLTSKVNKIKKGTSGRLVIKDYPTSTAHAGHFRALINELRTKKDFVPDAIVIDYLNICACQRMKYSADTYSYIKAIAEELRGLASEFNVALFSATQTNRDGFGSSDVDLTNTSESFGLPATADVMYALISNEVLQQQNQIMIKQLKNRYSDISNPKTRQFTIGINPSKMQLYNLEDQAQDDIGMKPTAPTPPASTLLNESNKKAKNNFSGFNF